MRMERVGPYVFQVDWEQEDSAGFRAAVLVRKGEHIIATYTLTGPMPTGGREQAQQEVVFRAWQLCANARVAATVPRTFESGCVSPTPQPPRMRARPRPSRAHVLPGTGLRIGRHVSGIHPTPGDSAIRPVISASSSLGSNGLRRNPLTPAAESSAGSTASA